jgi:hypothetical protein
LLSFRREREDNRVSCFGTYALVHFAFDGALARAFPGDDERTDRHEGPPENHAQRDLIRYSTFERLATADLDGDGEPEALVTTHWFNDEGNDTARPLAIYTFHNGSIVPFTLPGGAEVETATDFDHDGHVDLLTRDPYTAPPGCIGGHYPSPGPLFLIHSLPNGGLSTSDSTAIEYARRHCPRRPRSVIVMSQTQLESENEDASGADASVAPTLDERATGDALICARLRGASAREIRNELQVVCSSFAGPDPCSPVAPRECPHEWLAWLRIDPPLRIP